MRVLVVVVLLTACGSKRPEATREDPTPPVPRDASPATADAADALVAAPTITPGALAPVLVVGGRRFVDVSLWFELPPLAKDVDGASWGDGDVESVQLGPSPTASAPYVRLRAAPKAPPAWRAIAGVAVTGVSSRGTTCASTLGALSLLSHGPGNEIHEGYEGEPPIILAQITAPADCDPIALDTRPDPIVLASTGKPTAAQRAALVTAWRALSTSSAWDVDKLDRPSPSSPSPSSPSIEVFAGKGRSFALVVVEATRPKPGNCGQDYVGARAIYELGGATPVLRGSTDTSFANAKTIALIAHAQDISAVLGAATTDHGGSGTIEYGSILSFPESGKPAIATSTTTRYIGCD